MLFCVQMSEIAHKIGKFPQVWGAESASGWASALRVRPCLFSVTCPSRKIAETRIADAMPLAKVPLNQRAAGRQPSEFIPVCFLLLDRREESLRLG